LVEKHNNDEDVAYLLELCT